MTVPGYQYSVITMETAQRRDLVLLQDVSRLRAQLRSKCELLSRDLLHPRQSRRPSARVPKESKLEVSVHVQPKHCNDVSIGTDTEWRPVVDLLPKRLSVPIIELCSSAVSPSKASLPIVRPVRRLGTSLSGRRSQLASQEGPRRRLIRASLEDLQALCVGKDLDLLRSSRNRGDYRSRPVQTSFRYRRRRMMSRSEEGLRLEMVGRELPFAP